MDLLPLDVLPIVFSYLDAHTCIRCRFVSRRWRRNSSKGCIFIKVDDWLPLYPKEKRRSSNVVGSITLVGSREGIEERERDNARSNRLKRTRGHLPEPSVLVQGQERSSITFLSDILCDHKHESGVLSDAVATKCWQRGMALKLERGGQQNFESLDLEASTFEAAMRASVGRTGPLFDKIEGKPLQLKRMWRGCFSVGYVIYGVYPFAVVDL